MLKKTMYVFIIFLIMFVMNIGVLFADGWCPEHGQYSGDYCTQNHSTSRVNNNTDENTGTSSTTYDIYRGDSGNWRIQGEYRSTPMQQDDPRYEQQQNDQRTDNPTDQSGSLKLIFDF